MVPKGIGELIPEGTTELKFSCEGMGVSIPEGILEKESSGKIIFDLFPDLIDKFSSGGKFCIEPISLGHRSCPPG